MNCEKLKKYREMKNLTQQRMAKQIGIAHSGYVCVENGYKEPSLSVLKRISEVTGYPIQSLIYESDEDVRPQPLDELETYRAISFNLVKKLCVAPEAKSLGRNERDINELALKKLNYMIRSISGKARKEYEAALRMGGQRTS